MINTFHSSFNPPPVPPRQGHRGPVPSTNTPLVKFLSVMLLLLMLLTFGGFLYLFHRLSVMQYGYSTLKQLQQCEETHLNPELKEYCKKLYNLGLSQEGTAFYLTERDLSTIPLARLVPHRDIQTRKSEDQPNTLLWNKEHSLLKKIHLSTNGTVTIDYPGYYFLHSQVGFSKAHSKALLRQVIWSWIPKEDSNKKVDWEKLLVSFCSLSQSSTTSDVCTASQAGVFELVKGQQLFINVTSRDLVNAESTTFGLFKLHD